MKVYKVKMTPGEFGKVNSYFKQTYFWKKYGENTYLIKCYSNMAKKCKRWWNLTFQEYES